MARREPVENALLQTRARRDPLLAQALLESATKYGPQGNALRSLLQGLAGSYTRTRRTNASTAAGIAAATRQARPDVAGAFDQALRSSTAQRAALGVGAPDPQAAAFERRMSEQRAQALGDLSDRELRAVEGRVFANQTARDEYLGGKSKILSQLQDLDAQQGANTASRYGQLRDAQLQRGLTRRAQNETRRSNRVNEDIAQQRADTSERSAERAARQTAKPKLKPASLAAHAKARDLIEEAVAQVRDLRQDTPRRSEIIALLVKGIPATKAPDGTPVPAIPKLPPDFVRAATNLVFDKSLSRGDVERLHNRRLKIRALGYPTRRPVSRPKSAAQLAGRGGGSRIGSRPPVAGLR